MTQIIKIQEEINKELGNKETMQALVTTTFKGLEMQMMKRAIMEGMMRGFAFKDFLEKNIYAIPFKGGYSLITSIDYARKVGMRSGVIGKSAPVYEMSEDGKTIISCTITIKRKLGSDIGEYSETVYFNEYTTGRNLWLTKPRTMIAKVAEMHALRMACPEELSQAYTEEEVEVESTGANILDEKYKKEIDALATTEELKTYYLANKGRGKDFDKYVTKRKKELETVTETPHENS